MTEISQVDDKLCPYCFHYFISSHAVSSHKPYCKKNPNRRRTRDSVEKPVNMGSPLSGWENVSLNIDELHVLKEERQKIVEQLYEIDARIRLKTDELNKKAKEVIYRNEIEK